MKKLATLIPVHNPGKKLCNTLDSMLNNYDGDIIIVNDGGDFVSLNSLIDNYRALNIFVINIESNVGITKALNRGLEHIIEAGYEYVARIDAGDIALEGRFERQLKALESDIELGMIGCQVDIRDINRIHQFYHLNPTDNDKLAKAMYTRNPFFHSSVMMRCALLKKIGFYDESFIVAQDYELFFRICKYSKVSIVDDILVYDLYNPNGITYSRRSLQLKAKLRAQLMYFNIFEPRSYMGIAKSILIILLPDAFVWHVKKLIKR